MWILGLKGLITAYYRAICILAHREVFSHLKEIKLLNLICFCVMSGPKCNRK